MARSKPNPPTASTKKPAAKSSPAKAAKSTRDAAAASAGHPLARRRALVLAVLSVVALLTLGGTAIWQRFGPLVAGRERYLLPADGITISDPPEWIVGDVRRQVIESAGLAGRLTVLDPDFLTKIESAFKLHPWIESVTRVEKKYPPAVFVEVVYRRPVAVIEVPHGESKQLLPVDSQCVQLPAVDVPEIRLSYLPRITGVVGQPTAGQKWDDPRVPGAVDLAVQLADDWESLNLKDIIPSAWPKVQDDRQFFLYDFVTRGGTRIVWGAPPRDGVPGEAEFAVKLARLKQCVAQYATRDWTDWPAVIDIRSGIEITPRTAKKPPKADEDEPVVAEHPEVVAEKPEKPADAAAEPVVK